MGTYKLHTFVRVYMGAYLEALAHLCVHGHIIIIQGIAHNNIIGYVTTLNNIPCSRKYWSELNLVVEPKITIATIILLADLNLAVRYRITIYIPEILANLISCNIDYQTTKFSSYTVHNATSYTTLIGVHKMHRQMHPNYGHSTSLLASHHWPTL